MNDIEKFVAIRSNSGFGHGGGSGYDCGGGYSFGGGGGYSFGSGDGSGNSSGFGRSDSCGHGGGDGCGYGGSRGDGDGGGYNKDIKSFNGNPVYYIDGISTIIAKVRKNVARGFILNNDLTTTPCYIIKQNNLFAHGKTLAKAREALRDKLFENMDEEERIDAFLDEFNLIDKYPAMKFFEWHNKLTGSCELGRKAFVKNHGIDLNADSFTVAEFCELCKNDYGSDVIRKILEQISKQTG